MIWMSLVLWAVVPCMVPPVGTMAARNVGIPDGRFFSDEEHGHMSSVEGAVMNARREFDKVMDREMLGRGDPRETLGRIYGSIDDIGRAASALFAQIPDAKPGRWKAFQELRQRVAMPQRWPRELRYALGAVEARLAKVFTKTKERRRDLPPAAREAAPAEVDDLPAPRPPQAYRQEWRDAARRRHLAILREQGVDIERVFSLGAMVSPVAPIYGDAFSTVERNQTVQGGSPPCAVGYRPYRCKACQQCRLCRRRACSRFPASTDQ